MTLESLVELLNKYHRVQVMVQTPDGMFDITGLSEVTQGGTSTVVLDTVLVESFGHTDGDYDRECAYTLVLGERTPACPECKSTDIELTMGDHGYTCNQCDADFTVP